MNKTEMDNRHIAVLKSIVKTLDAIADERRDLYVIEELKRLGNELDDVKYMLEENDND